MSNGPATQSPLTRLVAWIRSRMGASKAGGDGGAGPAAASAASAPPARPAPSPSPPRPAASPANGPVTWNKVKRLFTGADISYMKMYGLRLDDPDWVKANLDARVLSRIRDGTMPPSPPFALWTGQMIDELEAWKAGGFVVSDPALAQEEAKFIAMSEFLTGFDDLGEDPELAHTYHELLLNRKVDDGGVDRDVLSKLIAAFDPADTSSFEAKLEDPENKKAAQTVILLWYTAAFIDLGSGFPAGTNATAGEQYPAGLVWRAIEAHPMGYSAEGYFDHQKKQYSLKGEPYWRFKPEADGRNTGLGPTSSQP